MEDRCTQGMYLELGSGSLEQWVERSAVLEQLDGVQRVTWWENCVPRRKDLPMKIEDGSTLVVAEVDEVFSPPAAPESLSVVNAHHFRRHSRPSQGILSGHPTKGLLVVWISPRTLELASRLRDWGDFVHIRHIAAAGIPGFTQISVFENVKAVDPMYMHFYEFDSDEPEKTFSTMTHFVAPRLGGFDSEEFAAWADWREPGGRLFYCNTFRLLGEA
ncbi:MAG TPA: hypothetical protein VEJ87_02790 [Acidimicrobiales bacterium]|nr:hypothetical protein [Acidimicrobiales bacterium]